MFWEWLNDPTMGPYNSGRNGTLSITKNNHLILKAFATAWRYREMYEQGGVVDSIDRTEHIALRHVYRCLEVAYMNPEIVNKILSGKQQINIDDIYKLAKENQL